MAERHRNPETRMLNSALSKELFLSTKFGVPLNAFRSIAKDKFGRGVVDTERLNRKQREAVGITHLGALHQIDNILKEAQESK